METKNKESLFLILATLPPIAGILYFVLRAMARLTAVLAGIQ